MHEGSKRSLAEFSSKRPSFLLTLHGINDGGSKPWEGMVPRTIEFYSMSPIQSPCTVFESYDCRAARYASQVAKTSAPLELEGRRADARDAVVTRRGCL